MLSEMCAPRFLSVALLNSSLIQINLGCAQQKFCLEYNTLKNFLTSTKLKLVLIEFAI